MSDVTAFYISVVTIDVVECTLCTETINVSLDSQSTYYTEQRRRQTLLDANKLATVLKISVQSNTSRYCNCLLDRALVVIARVLPYFLAGETLDCYI